MRKRQVVFLVLGLLVVVLAGCSSQLTLPPQNRESLFLSRWVENSSSRVLLDVPFLPQVPPGDWANTRNCGVAAAVMVKAYYYGSTPTPQDIVEADEWLHARFGLPLNNYNGDFTNVFQIRSWLEAQGISTRIGMGNGEMLRSFLKEGKPVIVAVFAHMNPRSAKHAMLLVGMTQDAVIVHDPGKPNGASNVYSLNQFLSSWQAQNNWYITIE